VKKSAGQVIILIPLILVVAMLVIGFSFDLGNVLIHKNRAQSAVDAAALAGATALTQGPSAVARIVHDYAVRNGVSASAVTIENPYQGDPLRLHVSVVLTVPYYFTPIIGIRSQSIRASSVASASGPAAYSGCSPLSMPSANYQRGQSYEIKQDHGENGNWGALALGGSGSTIFKGNFKFGHGETLRTGQTISTEPGRMEGPSEEAFAYRYMRGTPGESWANCTEGNSRVVLVLFSSPSPYDVQGRGNITIRGFGLFFLESEYHGAMTARFIGMADQYPLGQGQQRHIPSRLLE